MKLPLTKEQVRALQILSKYTEDKPAFLVDFVKEYAPENFRKFNPGYNIRTHRKRHISQHVAPYAKMLRPLLLKGYLKADRINGKTVYWLTDLGEFYVKYKNNFY